MMEKYYCAVCENEITLDDCYNCFVCGWDSDPVQEANPHYRGGANKCSLHEAKAAWAVANAKLKPSYAAKIV